MKSYLITIVSKMTKQFLIESASSEDAIAEATDIFLSGDDDAEELIDSEINSLNINVESLKPIENEAVNIENLD